MPVNVIGIFYAWNKGIFSKPQPNCNYYNKVNADKNSL